MNIYQSTKELLYFPDDLEEEGKAMKENIVCRIRVKEELIIKLKKLRTERRNGSE